MDAIPKLAVAAGNGELRSHLESLPQFPLDRLTSEHNGTSKDRQQQRRQQEEGEVQREGRGDSGAQLWRAYMVLSFLSHAYIWCDGPETPQRLPAVLARPWAAVAGALDMPPVLVYSTYNLLNWRRLDASKPVALGNLVCLNNFLGGMDEEWFRVVHLAIEAAATPAVSRLEELQHAARQGDEAAMEPRLQEIRSALTTMQQLLGRMGEKCDPHVYYHRVRLPMSGWSGNARLPGGLVYEGVSGDPLQLYGETGAQSSVVASLDAALGIEHECGWLRDYLLTMHKHMPPPHRRFIERLEANNAAAAAAGAPTVRSAAVAGGRRLRDTYNEAVSELEAFRAQHRSFAAQYIAVFAKKEETGTGGSDFMPALAGFRKTTAAHKLS